MQREWVSLLYRWRVRASLVSVVAALVLARPNGLSLMSGSGFIILGLLLRGWACGHLNKNRELSITGPYRYTRNPLYLGSLLIGLGVTAASRSWWVAAVFAANFLFFFTAAVLRERRVMQEMFPSAYAEYSRRVPLFFPALRPAPQGRGKRFSWSLYATNREYRALLGASAFLGLIVLKWILFQG